MKNLILILALVASIYSCTKETDDIATKLDYTGKWELVKMTGSATYTEYNGSDMEWQETYTINNDQTFSKTRVRGDSTIIVSGTYTFSEEGLLDESETDVITYIQFLHDTDNKIIGNCHSNRAIEYLYFTSDYKLKSTWEACDGPGLEYIKNK